MAIDQLDLILQFCIRFAAVFIITAVAIWASRRLAKPVGTYGQGLPERRMRPRVALRVPPPAAPRTGDVASATA